VRRVWLVLGLALLAFGVRTLFFGDTNGTRPLATACWAALALIAHDGVLAPAAFALGWLLPRRLRPVAAPILLLAAVAALLWIPRWRSPAPRQNASVWPAVSTVDIVLAGLLAAVTLGCAQLIAHARGRRSSGRPGASGR
jgi:hypothetical protein